MLSRSQVFRQAVVLVRLVQRDGWRLARTIAAKMSATVEVAAVWLQAIQSYLVGRAVAPVARACAIDKLSRRHQRVVAALGAVATQLLLLLVLVIGGRVVLAQPPEVAEVMVSGPWGSPEAKPKPPEVIPELPTVSPPEIEISDAVDPGADATPGLPNVSRPAEAIAAAHLFPPAPGPYRSGGPHSVVLLLSVSEGGAVNAAAVQVSSGITTLDGMALEWVKKHWRYLPALRNGIPVGVTTTAVLTFLNT